MDSTLKHFAVTVAHPKSGAESRVVIRARTRDEAAAMANSAGLLVASVGLAAPGEIPEDEREAARLQKLRTRKQWQDAYFWTALFQLARLAWTFGGILISIIGLILLLIGGNPSAAVTIGIGLGIQAVMMFFKWFWADRGPWI